MDAELTLLQINDTHAYLDAHPELFWSGSGPTYRTVGGFGRIAALVQQVRQQQDGRVLLFDGGDTFHGTYPAVQTRGATMIPALNVLGIDAMTGHWDFAYGPARLHELVAQLDYPMLAANCYRQDTRELVFPPSVVREAGGLRVGVIGIAATIIDKTMPPHFSEGIYLTLGKDELPSAIERLRDEERADLVVVVSHLGFAQDLQIAQDVDGIDVLLSAHTHNRVYAPARVNKTLVIQSGCDGSFVGRLDLQVGAGGVVDYRHALLTVEESITPDADVQALVDEALAPYRDMLSEVVGRTDVALNRNTVLEATMDNILLQALLKQTGARVAFSNGWRYGAPVPAGAVTLNDLFNIVPMNPPVMTVDMTGEEMWTMLEENIQHTFARDPYEQMGGYLKRMMGLKLIVKLENPHGQRVQEIFVGDEALDRKQVVPVAFVTEQGVPSKFGTNRQQHDIRAVDAMRRLLQHESSGWELADSVVAV